MAKIKLLSGAAIDKGITEVCKQTHVTGPMIHKYGVQALLHAATHGDPRKLDALYKGLHRHARPEALKTWIEKYSPVRWNGDGKVGLLKQTAKNFTPFDVESANADPYWTPTENVGKPLTMEALRAIIGNLAKKMAKADEGKLEIAEGENVIVMRNYVKRMQEADELAARLSTQAAASATQEKAPAPKKKTTTKARIRKPVEAPAPEVHVA